VVAQDVRRVSLEAWIGIAVGAGGLIFAWLAWRVSKEELRLTQEEATLRPKLVISFKAAVPHPRPPDPGTEHPHSAIVFNITNDGRSAAHNVHCEVHLDERCLVPDEMYGANHEIFEEYIGPKNTKPHQINVALLAHGPTEARYRFVCDEVGESEGTIKFEVPEWKNPLEN
jgi:hypothetical protein